MTSLFAPFWRWAPTTYSINAFQSGHAWVPAGTYSAADMDDTGDSCRGDQSAYITTSGTNAPARIERIGAPALNLTGKAIRLLVKVDDVSHLSSVNFYVGDSGLANSFKWRLNATSAASQLIPSGEWVCVTFSWADVHAAYGSYSLSATGASSVTTGFTDRRFEVYDDAGGQITAHIQAVELVDDTTATYPSGVVSITFDDSNASVYELAYPVMAYYSLRGTTYNVAESVGTPGRLSLAQLRNLQDFSGWEVGGHSFTAAAHNSSYINLTAAEVDADLAQLREWLILNSFRGESFAYPHGKFSATSDGTPACDLVRRYFSSGRTILCQLGTSKNILTETDPPAMPYRLRGMSSVSSLSTGQANPESLLAPGGALDRARNGSWLILAFHTITTGTPAATTQCSLSDFTAIMAQIAGRGVAVVPVGDVVRGVR